MYRVYYKKELLDEFEYSDCTEGEIFHYINYYKMMGYKITTYEKIETEEE